jgi:hypothetical protein
MAAFGFSIDDFVTCLTLVKNLVEAVKDSTGSVSELKSLLQTLQALNEAVTNSQIVHLQWEALIVNPAFRKNSLAMINGMEFARQQSKKLLEEFIESLQPYTDAFIRSTTESLCFATEEKSSGNFRKTRRGSWSKISTGISRHCVSIPMRCFNILRAGNFGISYPMSQSCGKRLLISLARSRP